MKPSVIQNLIEELERFAKMPMVDKPTIEAAIAFTKNGVETERLQIIEAYYAGTLQFENSALMIYPKTPQDYYSETYNNSI